MTSMEMLVLLVPVPAKGQAVVVYNSCSARALSAQRQERLSESEKKSCSWCRNVDLD